jgi:RNA polymerase-binding transcription factor DksA
MAIVVAVGRYGAWRCPKCGERFHLSRRLSNPLARRCLHCGLAKKDPRPHRP